MMAQIGQNSHAVAKPKILVIEDEPALSRVLSLVFKGGGFDVCIAATGGDGLRLCELQRFLAAAMPLCGERTRPRRPRPAEREILVQF
jgi:CheY-like chemotaxis protein